MLAVAEEAAPVNDITPRERRRIIALVEASDSGLAEKLAEALDGSDTRLVSMLERSLTTMTDNVTKELRSTRFSNFILSIVTIVAMVAVVGGNFALKGFGVDVSTTPVPGPVPVSASVDLEE